ncbi:MAG: SprB repeat-containing protein, partial [Cyclobacteriaceae bacterium]
MIRRLLNTLFYFNLLIAWAFSYQASAQTITNCQAAAATSEDGHHAVWLNKYAADGTAASFVFDNQGGVLEENAVSGTAHLEALIYNTKDPGDKWIIDLNLSNRMNWDQWSALGRGYKDEQNLAGDNYKDWSYYILDTGVASTLTGAGKNNGKVITLAHNPVNYYYGFQVGDAANSKNANYGLSGWFLYSLDGADPINGDFNLDLSGCENDPLPEECNDCFSTNVLKVEEKDNCINYSIEVLQDGTCEHALSHFTVGIPCGTVSNVSNSEDWAIETGQDPTTDLYGFKIDDIKNFGESSSPQSFTVDFTVCTDDAACKETLDKWSAVVAYKAAQCVNYDTLDIETPPVIGGEDPVDFPYTDICLASPVEGRGHALWLNKYDANNKPGRFIFESDPGILKENQDNGTAYYTGTLINKKDSDDGWVIDLWLSDKMNWSEWSALGRDYKDQQNLAGENYKDWSYYIMDLSKTSTLTGIGKNEGKVMTLAHNPTDYKYGFQVGTAANSINSNYGLSGWFLYSSNGANPINGDVNLDLYQCETVEPDPGPEPDPIPTDTVICDVNDFAAYLAVKDISCIGNDDGQMSVQIAGGQGPFSFAWSNGATTQDLKNLAAGAYMVTVTDGAGEALELAGVITEPDPMNISGNITIVTCAGNDNGAIHLTVTGGISPYTYNWSTGATTAN